MNPSSFQQPLNNQPNALNNSPYLDYNNLNSNYNSLNPNYTSSMINQVPQTPPCTVPNMFTAAVVAAASHSGNSSSKLSSSNLNNSSEFPFNSNSNLNKKYLNKSSLDNSTLQSSTSGLESSLDQTIFYGTNGSTPLNKSTGLQSPLKPHQTSEFVSTSLVANNYANFAPNSNNAYWQPGKYINF